MPARKKSSRRKTTTRKTTKKVTAKKSGGKAKGQPQAEIRRLVQKYNQAWANADLKALDRLTAEDAKFHSPPPGLSGDKQGILESARIFHDAFPDQQVRFDHVIASKDSVACHFTAQGTHQGEFMGIPPTGKRVQIEGLTIVSVRNGKVVEDITEIDAMRLMDQLGANGPGNPMASAAGSGTDYELWGAPYRP